MNMIPSARPLGRFDDEIDTIAEAAVELAVHEIAVDAGATVGFWRKRLEERGELLAMAFDEDLVRTLPSNGDTLNEALEDAMWERLEAGWFEREDFHADEVWAELAPQWQGITAIGLGGSTSDMIENTLLNASMALIARLEGAIGEERQRRRA